MTNKPPRIVTAHQGFGSVKWEYVGTCDVFGTCDAFGKAVPRVKDSRFGTVVWDVWVPLGDPGYNDKQVAKWQATCPHSFHDDALEVLFKHEASVVVRRRPEDVVLKTSS